MIRRLDPWPVLALAGALLWPPGPRRLAALPLPAAIPGAVLGLSTGKAAFALLLLAFAWALRRRLRAHADNRFAVDLIAVALVLGSLPALSPLSLAVGLCLLAAGPGSPRGLRIAGVVAAAATIVGAAAWRHPLAPPAADAAARALAAHLEALAFAAPWVLLAIPGLVRRPRPGRGAEHGLVAGATLLALAGAAVPGLAGPGTLGLVVPALAIPAATTAARLRDRPGRTGPRLAGGAAGLVVGSVVLGLAGAGAWPPAIPGIGLAFAGAATLPSMALFPGRASPRGRAVACGIAVGVAAVTVAAVALARRILG